MAKILPVHRRRGAIRKLAAATRGAAGIEYALLVFLIGMVLLASLKSMGLSLTNIMDFVSETITNVLEGN